MDKIPDEVFAILTAKQKEVYLLRMEGISETLRRNLQSSNRGKISSRRRRSKP